VSTWSTPQPLPVIVSSPPATSLLALNVCVREAVPDEAPDIYALVTEHLTEGHLLPRSLEEISAHVPRFLVAVRDGRVVGCGELAPLNSDVSEIRSLVVSSDVRGLGLGAELIERLVDRAMFCGFEKVCAFTHLPSYFVHHGFSIVPHVWLPEKIVTDCHNCPQFRRCGQYAVVRTLKQRRVRNG
jgi:amino-acid N-acetyltransferase